MANVELDSTLKLFANMNISDFVYTHIRDFLVSNNYTFSDIAFASVKYYTYNPPFGNEDGEWIESETNHSLVYNWTDEELDNWKYYLAELGDIEVNDTSYIVLNDGNWVEFTEHGMLVLHNDMYIPYECRR